MKDTNKLNEEELNAGIISQNNQKSLDKFLDYVDAYGGGEYDGLTKDNVKTFVAYANILEFPEENGSVKWSIAENEDGNPQLYYKDCEAESLDWQKSSLSDMYKVAKGYVENDMTLYSSLIREEGKLPELAEIFKDCYVIQEAWKEVPSEEKRAYSACKKYVNMNPSDRSILESFYDDSGNYHNEISFFEKGHINYLLKHNIDLKPFVYFAATDAFLGDDLNNLLKVIPKSEWKKIRADKEWCTEALSVAEESIKNDSELTINPTLDFAEKLGMLKEAFEYCKNLEKEVQASSYVLDYYRENLKEFEKKLDNVNEITNTSVSKTIHFYNIDIDENYFNEQVTNRLQPYFDEYNEACTEESEKIKLTGVKFYGTNNGQLKILVAYEGDLSEDGLYNTLYAANLQDGTLSYNGYSFDLNPIKPEKSGTIEEYLEFLKINDFEENHGIIVKDRESGNFLKVEPVASGSGYMTDLFDKNQKFINHDLFEEDSTLAAAIVSISDYAKDNLWGKSKNYDRIKNINEYESLWNNLSKESKSFASNIEKFKNQIEITDIASESDHMIFNTRLSGKFLNDLGIPVNSKTIYTLPVGIDSEGNFYKIPLTPSYIKSPAEASRFSEILDVCKDRILEIVPLEKIQKEIEDRAKEETYFDVSKRDVEERRYENKQDIFNDFLSDVEKEYRELKLFRQATINVLKNLPEDKKEYVNQELLKRGANNENSLANIMKDAIQQKIKNENQELNRTKSLSNKLKKYGTDYDRER